MNAIVCLISVQTGGPNQEIFTKQKPVNRCLYSHQNPSRERSNLSLTSLRFYCLKMSLFDTHAITIVQQVRINDHAKFNL